MKLSKKEHLLSWGLILLGLSLAIIFGFNVIRGFLRGQFTGLEPGTTDPANIRGWMTVPYIANFYEVPEDYIFDKIDIPAEGNRKKSLGKLNRQYASGQSGEIPEQVREALRTYQNNHSREVTDP